MQVRCCLDLDDQLSVHDHIESLLANLVTFVHHGRPNFARDLMPAGDKLSMQADDINAFEKPEAERVVHVVKRPNRGMSQTLLNELMSGHQPTFVDA